MAEVRKVGTRFAQALNGTTFAAEVAGEGEPLLLVHAGIADRRMWDDQMAPFAARHRVIRYDMRGYGKTPMVAGPFSHRQDLTDLLHSLGVEHVCLLGCSIGGQTAIDVALEHSTLVTALILVGAGAGGARPPGPRPRQWDELEAACERGDLARAAELEVQIWVDGPHRSPEQVDAAVRERVRTMDLIALAAEAANLGQEQPLEPPAAGRLAELQVPTLILVGDQDQPRVLENADMLAQCIAGARKVVLLGVAHLPNMEQPDEFNRLVLEWLAGQ